MIENINALLELEKLPDVNVTFDFDNTLYLPKGDNGLNIDFIPLLRYLHAKQKLKPADNNFALWFLSHREIVTALNASIDAIRTKHSFQQLPTFHQYLNALNSIGIDPNLIGISAEGNVLHNSRDFYQNFLLDFEKDAVKTMQCFDRETLEKLHRISQSIFENLFNNNEEISDLIKTLANEINNVPSNVFAQKVNETLNKVRQLLAFNTKEELEEKLNNIGYFNGQPARQRDFKNIPIENLAAYSKLSLTFNFHSKLNANLKNIFQEKYGIAYHEDGKNTQIASLINEKKSNLFILLDDDAGICNKMNSKKELGEKNRDDKNTFVALCYPNLPVEVWDRIKSALTPEQATEFEERIKQVGGPEASVLEDGIILAARATGLAERAAKLHQDYLSPAFHSTFSSDSNTAKIEFDLLLACVQHELQHIHLLNDGEKRILLQNTTHLLFNAGYKKLKLPHTDPQLFAAYLKAAFDTNLINEEISQLRFVETYHKEFVSLLSLTNRFIGKGDLNYLPLTAGDEEKIKSLFIEEEKFAFSYRVPSCLLQPLSFDTIHRIQELYASDKSKEKTMLVDAFTHGFYYEQIKDEQIKDEQIKDEQKKSFLSDDQRYNLLCHYHYYRLRHPENNARNASPMTITQHPEESNEARMEAIKYAIINRALTHLSREPSQVAAVKELFPHITINLTSQINSDTFAQALSNLCTEQPLVFDRLAKLAKLRQLVAAEQAAILSQGRREYYGNMALTTFGYGDPKTLLIQKLAALLLTQYQPVISISEQDGKLAINTEEIARASKNTTSLKEAIRELYKDARAKDKDKTIENSELGKLVVAFDVCTDAIPQLAAETTARQIGDIAAPILIVDEEYSPTQRRLG